MVPRWSLLGVKDVPTKKRVVWRTRCTGATNRVMRGGEPSKGVSQVASRDATCLEGVEGITIVSTWRVSLCNCLNTLQPMPFGHVPPTVTRFIIGPLPINCGLALHLMQMF